MTRSALFLLFAGTLLGCGGSTVAGQPGGDGGSAVDASFDHTGPEAGADAAPDASDANPTDDAADATGCTHPGPALTAPTFDPPSGECFPQPGSATLTAPTDPPGTQIFYSTNGLAPSPQDGTLYTGPIPVDVSETIVAIAHLPNGCVADSPPSTAIYMLSPNPPNPSCDSAPLQPVIFNPPSTPSYTPFLLGLTYPAPGATLCYTLDGSTPSCSATGSCTGSALTYDAAAPISIAPAITQASTGDVTVTALACEAGYSPGPAVSQHYQLLLVAPFLASANSDGSGQPGWQSLDGGGAPGTIMTIPSDAGVPYGPFTAQQMGNGAYPLADYLCWSKAGPATCGCAAPLSLTKAAPSATLPTTADVSPGNTLSVVACQSSPSVNAATGYGPSSATTVQF